MSSLFCALIWVIVVCYCGYTARQKNRSVVGWAFAGGIFGLFAVPFIFLLKPKPLVVAGEEGTIWDHRKVVDIPPQ